MKFKLKNEVSKTPAKSVSKKETKKNLLPPDEYEPMFPPMRMLVKKSPSKKDPSKEVRQYLEVSVKRFNDDDALPHVWLQMYMESDLYTGYLKGKTVYFPLSTLYDVIDTLTETGEYCDKNDIVD